MGQSNTISTKEKAELLLIAGLANFERALDRDERMMAVLGARLLRQKKVGETTQAIELRQGGESSILGSIAGSVSSSLNQILRWVYWWNSTKEYPHDQTQHHSKINLNILLAIHTRFASNPYLYASEGPF